MWKVLMVLAIGAVLCLPGLASADYVQGWQENGLYGLPGTYQAWNKIEAFLITPGNWTGTGLSAISAPGWTAALYSPTYSEATGPLYDSNVASHPLFYYTTSSTDRTTPWGYDWFLWNGSHLVGVERVTWTAAAGWSYLDLTANPPSENRVMAASQQDAGSAVPLPPTILLLGSGLLALSLLRGRKLLQA